MSRPSFAAAVAAALCCLAIAPARADRPESPLQRAREDLQRAQKLYDAGSITKAELDRVEALFLIARVDRERAQADTALGLARERYRAGAETIDVVDQARLQVARAAADQARARALLPSRELAHARTLYRAGALTKRDLDRIESAAKRAAVDAAQAEKEHRSTEIETARIHLERARKLYEVGGIPAADLHEAEDAYEAALHPLR